MKIKVEKLVRMLGWVSSFNFVKGEKFKYNELSFKLLIFPLYEEIEINEETISNIMNDMYEHYKKIIDDKDNALERVRILSEMKNDKSIFTNTVAELNSFMDTYENMLIEHNIPKFKYQKLILNNLMEQYIHEEKYEICSKIRDRIKKLN